MTRKPDDGKIDGAEIGAALAATASDAIKAIWGAGEISAEMKDLTDAERTELVDMAMPVLLRMVQLFAPEK